MATNDEFPIDLSALAPSRAAGVVAVEPLPGGEAALFIRSGAAVARRVEPFHPFLLVAGSAMAAGLRGVRAVQELEGPGVHRVLVSFEDVRAHDAAVRKLKEATGRAPSAPGAPYRVFTDLAQQALAALGVRLFRGMPFAALRRMQFDIETLCEPGYDFPSPARPGDRIVAISLSDSDGWEECLCADSLGEPEMLARFAQAVASRDPDVLEGHNIFKFDLPYILARARMHGVPLPLGRGGEQPATRASRVAIAENIISYQRVDVHGRHVVDTYFLAQLYDATHRELESLSLKDVARHFKVSPPGRVYADASRVADLLARDPGTLRAYAMDDAREVRAVSNILLPSYFHQAQIIPLSLQNCVVRGNATRIDALLTSAYLEARAALPAPQPAREFAGGLAGAPRSGVFHGVWHCDARSLYPSIMLAEGISPRSDHLGAFARTLRALRDARLACKDAARAAGLADAARANLDAMQAAFKVVINSYYGYLGFSQGTFNDFDAAERVASRGREILEAMLRFLGEAGAAVIEMDTDGVYFQPPPSCGSDTKAFERRLQAALPPGIEVEIDATYRAMFSYKSKNYALLRDDGVLDITGAALKSRGIEPFIRDYIHEIVRALATGDGDPEAITARFAADIRARATPLPRLARSVTLSESPESYQRKRAAGRAPRDAAQELALASGRPYAAGDQVSYYVTGTRRKVSVVENSRLLADAPPERDENIEYYLGKLMEVRMRFAPFFPAGTTPDPRPIQPSEGGLGL